MTRLVIHNHMPRRAVDIGRSVSREEEERNRSAAYRATGISRDENQGLARELERLRDAIAKAEREGDKDKVRELRQLYNEAQGSLIGRDAAEERQVPAENVTTSMELWMNGKWHQVKSVEVKKSGVRITLDIGSLTAWHDHTYKVRGG